MPVPATTIRWRNEKSSTPTGPDTSTDSSPAGPTRVQHPQMTFVSRSVGRRGDGLEVVGDLTIRGATRQVVLSVDEVTPEHTDPWGNRRVGASARTRIRRSDFGMRWNAALEAGGVLVGDEVSIQLEVELVLQK
jgi:polyisoprenoid-binding protein YceI